MTGPYQDPRAPEAVSADADGNRFALRRRPCPVCGIDAGRVLGLRGGPHHRYGHGVESRIVRCRRCGLVFADPFPYPLDPQRLYGDPDGYFRESGSERRLLAHRALLREIAARLGKRNFSLLDVGSCRGELLAAARMEGARAIGLESSRAMVSQARDRLSVEIHCETIEEFASRYQGAGFEVVTLCGVLEHVHEPNSLLASVRRLSEPESLLYIDVPREPNLLTLVGNAWNFFTGSPAVYNLQPTWPPYHVFGFNPKAIRILLSKHGYAIEELKIRVEPHVTARDDWKDRLRAFVATQIHRLGNHTRLASNMFVWARRH